MAGSTAVDTSINAGGLINGLTNIGDMVGGINDSIELINKLREAWKKAEVSAKAYALAQKAMSLGSAAVNAVIQPLTKLPGLFAQLTVAQDMATKKQILWNIATAAFPIVAVVAGIAAVVAAIVLFSKHLNKETEETKRQREETEKLCAETQKLCEANKEVTDSISAGQAERQKKMEGIESEAHVSQKLTEELYKLADKENKSAAEKAKMKSIVDKLNEILPNLNLQFDEENGLLSLNKDKVEEVIAAKKKLAKQNAAAEMMSNAYLGQMQASSEMHKLLQQEAELKEKMKTLGGDNWDEAQTELKNLQANIKKTHQTFLEASEEYRRAQSIFDVTMNETTETAAISTEQIKQSFRSFAQEAPKSIAGVKSAVYEFGNELIGHSEIYGADFVDAWFGAIENAGDDAYQSLNTFMDYVLKSMDRDDDMKTRGTGGIENYVEGFKDGINEGSVDTSGIVEGTETAFEEPGDKSAKTWTEKFIKKINSSDQLAKESIEEMARKGVISVEPAMKESGEYASGGLISGILNAFTLINPANIGNLICEMIRTAVTGLQEKLAECGKFISEDLIGGIARGFQSIPGNLTSAISGFKDKLVEKFNNILKINSPSRVFAEEVGMPISEGIAVGITSGEGMVRSAAAEVVDAAIDEANRRISRDEHGNMLVEGLAVGITVGEDFGKDAMDAAVKNLKLQLDTAAITTADYYREIERLRNTHLTRGSEEWWKYTKEIMEYEQKRVEEAKKANKEAFEEELHLLERKQKLGLISEQEYYIGMKKLTRSYFTENEKEWQDYTEKLEDFVTKETQTLTDQVGKLLQGLYDEADKALQDVLSSMDSFRDSASNFGNYLFHFSVKDQNGRIIDQSTGLVDFSLRQKELERFTELFKQIKALPNIPKKILEDIRKMKPEDAVRLMELMLRTPQQALQNWFQAEQDFMDTIDTAADALYGDDLFAAEENIRKVDELKQSVLDMCNELGIKVPESFAAMGTAAKDSFFDMFKEVAGDIEGLMNQLQFTVSLNQSDLTVNVEPYSGTAATAASSSQTYAPTYYFAASGDSTARQIQAANANDTINRLRGVSF